jgi:hypothetical protein
MSTDISVDIDVTIFVGWPTTADNRRQLWPKALISCGISVESL